jgi:uncharacterized protein YpiB (UPF0302 family)
MVSKADKELFIKWLLGNKQMKKRECVWLLNYMARDFNLDMLHFVEKAEYCPKAVVMYTQCTDGVPFRFYKDGVLTTDVEKAFHDIRLNPQEKVYLQVGYHDVHRCSHWAMVCEDNPHYAMDKTSAKFGIYADMVIEDMLFKHELSRLDSEIDTALIQGDRELFMTLSTQRKELVGSKSTTDYSKAK